MKAHIFKIMAIALLLHGMPVVSGASIEKPSCEALKTWAESHEADQNFEPHPGVKLNTLFKDEKLIPVFKKPIAEWDRNDFRQLQGWLSACRKKAHANNDPTGGGQIYAALKSAKLASRAMKPIWLERKKANQQSAARQNSSRTQAKSAAEEQIKSQREQTARTRNKDSKRKAVQFTPAQHESLLEQIQAVPETRAGLLQLNRIAYNTNIGLMNREQRDSYNRAFQERRRLIVAKVADEEAVTKAKKEAEARKPMDLTPRLSWLFEGEEVDALTINGIRPGMLKKQAVAKIRGDWDLESDGMSIDSSSFTAKRQNKSKYKSERRSGGTVKLASMDKGKLGQLTFEEYYLGMSFPAQAQRWLSEKFGKPEKVQPGGGGVFMMWNEGDYRLQVFVTNQLDVFWRGAGYKSRIALSYWNEDYEDHLKKVNKQCNKIRSKDRNKWSMKDSTFFATQCNIDASGRRPGL